MGLAASSQRLLADHAELLEEFCGEKSWALSDSFWQELLTFREPLTRLPPKEVEAAAEIYCYKLVRNNPGTHNFQTLLSYILSLLDGAPDSVHTANAVYFVRVLLKYLTGSLNAPQLTAFSNGNAVPQDAPTVLDTFVAGVVESLVELPVRDETYLLHLELVNLLLVLASTQLYVPGSAGEAGTHPFTESLMAQPQLAPPLVQCLLSHYIAHAPLPARAPVYRPPPTERPGVFRLVRSAAASVLWLPMQAFTFLVRSGNQQLAESPLCDNSLLLLLALVHAVPPTGLTNPIQSALHHLQDEDDRESAPDGDLGSLAHVSYSRLFEALGRITNERTVLLLYDLLHDCQHFCHYALVRSDLETVLLPLLQMLYSGTHRAASQLYMLLIILLILSQDATFCQNVHAITLPSVPWYTDRVLKQTSLGSLMVVLLLRTAHYNLSRLKDVYLHTNTLASLANLAPHMAGLSSHAAQRLVSLFDMLSRRYRRLSRWAEEGKADAKAQEEAQVYYDFLRIVLEILNCIIVQGLPRNPELVYALLHRQEVFASLQSHPQMGELLENVGMVLNFFNERIDRARAAEGFEWSVSNVLDLIKASLRAWRPEALKRFPELRFTYEEEANPGDFFVPYVWSLVVSNTTIPWRQESIALFSPLGAVEEPTSLDPLESEDLAQRHTSLEVAVISDAV